MGEAGFDPRSIATLDDLWRAPSYTVDDIRRSIDDHPPWGDYQGVTPADALAEPMRVFMSGGTTGKSRPTFYTQWDREVGAVLTARALYMQGIRPGDVVLNSWAYGTHNGAFAFDEALHRWLDCVVVTTGTGNVTSSERQVELAIEYEAAAILTTGDYLLRLADVARGTGYDPAVDFKLHALPNIGDRGVLESTFGVECFESYGFHEVQWVSVECPAHDGLHIFEDAFVVQIVDPESGEPRPTASSVRSASPSSTRPGARSSATTSWTSRSSTRPGSAPAGAGCARWPRSPGRGDNMVKLRGVNVWPEAVGELALAVDGVAPDGSCARCGATGATSWCSRWSACATLPAFPAIGAAVETRLRDRLGVRIAVEVVAPGTLDAWTEVDVSPKLKRFRDER